MPIIRHESLSLVLPAYQEEAGIFHAIAEAAEALPRVVRRHEIIVVDDGSRDGTGAEVRRAQRIFPNVRLVQHDANRGYGAALRSGFEAARHERVAFTDADCQFHLVDLSLLLPLAEDAAVSVGYRVDRQDPWKRRFYSWGYNVLIRLLLGTGVRDVDCALKVFRREVLADLMPEARGFFVNTEMIVKARRLGFDIAETGVRHRPRIKGTSKVSVLDIPRTLSHLLPFWWRHVVRGKKIIGPRLAPAA